MQKEERGAKARGRLATIRDVSTSLLQWASHHVRKQDKLVFDNVSVVLSNTQSLFLRLSDPFKI